MSPQIRRIALVGHSGRPEVRREVVRLVKRLRRSRVDARVEAGLADAVGLAGEALPKLARWCQLMISLGGDGTVLVAGRSLAGRSAALLPINFGGLGFLAAAEASETDAALAAVLAGRWPVTARAGVEARVRRAGGTRWGARSFALNDVVVRSGMNLSAVHLQVAALGRDLGHLVADGLIAASASGSTAYALSAGGPILAPDVHAMVVTPACAHTLGSRALVLGPGATLGARLLSPGPAVVMLDGQSPITLQCGDEVEMRLARWVVRVHENPDRPFLHKLQDKLGWQGSERRSM